MSSDALCEESSVHEGAGYDEAFGSGHESKDFLLSSERGTSARSPDGNESCTGEDEMEDEVEKGREGEGVEGGINEVEKGMKATERRDLEITVLSFFLRIGPSTNFCLG